MGPIEFVPILGVVFVIAKLTDWGVFVPRGTLSKSIETGSPEALVKEVASMLAGSAHVREITADMN